MSEQNLAMHTIHVHKLETYSPEDAAAIGKLMPVLSARLTDEPIGEELLREIIESPHHEQLVARIDARIVGAATLSVILGTAAGKQGWLNDFVTDPATKGVGSALWNEMGAWCRDNGIEALNFTSHPNKTAAQVFYASRAERRQTNVFLAKFTEKE